MFAIAALYRFTPFPDPAALRDSLLAVCRGHGVTGTLLLAQEGINGTIAGPPAGVEAVLSHVRALPGCGGIEVKRSEADAAPFGRMKVRVKREIVTMGQPHVDPRAGTGRHVAPADWNDVIRDPGTVVIDTRNAYEVAIGSFAGALDPETEAFGDFPDWWRKNADRMAGKRIAMFCTGGIRCEKSTAFLRGEGVEDVVHLQGGILKYLEAVPETDSLWHGECFVFDDRVSVGHELRPGDHLLCHACRKPLSRADTKRPEYEPGVQCHRCLDAFDAADRARFRERTRQIALARARGTRHLGG
ncbi:rhodanese-related sulfurtransferase [Jannaschia sp. S6380]|uniref:oxygen-dependent tRNA uridine(34) hydroxylase TrhO n=1 Tax=Jannaschia sp. S6380 TaxID=2926408 RepID=UPI001FF2873E|nr:rhodanese-related sulfurtransferase [Jannaschia sp. S6380]MCK0169178.1 rhodanese-related sulfurtransferase [Jannaschia sp. S6380]